MRPADYVEEEGEGAAPCLHQRNSDRIEEAAAGSDGGGSPVGHTEERPPAELGDTARHH